MTVYELNREQLTELKVDYIRTRNEENGDPTFWSEIIYADEIISDEEIYEEYGNIDYFVDDDFFCTYAEEYALKQDLAKYEQRADDVPSPGTVFYSTDDTICITDEREQM